MTTVFSISHKSLLLVSLLATVMFSSLFVCVSVGGSSGVSLENAVYVKNEDELKKAINDTPIGGSTTIALDNDIKLTSYTLGIPANKTITLTSNKTTGYYKLMSPINIADGGVLRLDGITIQPTVKTEKCSGVSVCVGGKFFMYSGEISGHTASSSSDPKYAACGGGVWNYGVFEMHGGEIFGNTAEGGGGVYNARTFNMFGGVISGNTASYSGGGVANEYGGSFNMFGGVISGNTATKFGGGVANTGSFVWSGGKIYGNTATVNGNDVFPDGDGNSSSGDDETSDGNGDGGVNSGQNNGDSSGEWGIFSLRDVVFIGVGVAVVVVGVVVAVLLFTYKKELEFTKGKKRVESRVTEHQRQNIEVSPVVQQALGKLNVRMADLMEQINIVVKVLIEENVELQTKLGSVQSQQTLNVESKQY